MSGLDRLVGGAGMRDVYGEAREAWGASHPGFAFDEDVAGSVIESYARDADWIARNLGDVPYRHTGGLWELVAAVGVDGPLPVRVSPSEPHAWLCDVTLRD